MTILRQILGELTRAMCVLALLVFGLGAVSGPVQIGASPAVAAAIALQAGELCGGGFGDDHAHVACHACRGDVPLLPPAPCLAVPVAFAAEPVTYAAPRLPAKPVLSYGAAPARAPPAIVTASS